MIKIVVIDSGLDWTYNCDKIRKGISVCDGTNGLMISEDYTDHVGHGTATIDLIFQNNPNVEIIPVRICDDGIHTSLERLCFALRYIIEYVDFDIIQASLGVITYSRELHQYIKYIVRNMGKIVVSAFANSGAISYPAAFEEVIGIDINHDYKNSKDYDISYGGIADILGGEVYYRTAFLDGKRTVIHGTSLLASYFTAIIASIYHPAMTKEEVMEYLSKEAKRKLNYTAECMSAKEFMEGIKKAVVFPFNKEIHSIAAFEELVSFKIDGYYDIKHKFLLGRKINEVLGYSSNEKIIQNISNLDWEGDFDTIILGHLGEISNILKRDILNEILVNCVKYKKRAYCFDNLFEIISGFQNTMEIYSPYEMDDSSFKRLEGKMNIPHIPLLEICGTSSRQGKYSVQLSIIRELLKRNIKTGSLGTEPSAPLLGFDECVPFGYGSYDAIEGKNLVKYSNSLIWKIERTDPEIIITGSQSGMISNSIFHERSLHLNQYSFLLGTNPDGVILCVNMIDEVEFIQRTIQFIEAAIGTKIFAIVLCDSERMYSTNVFSKNVENCLKISKEICEKKFGLSVFSMPELDAGKLVDEIIHFYS